MLLLEMMAAVAHSPAGSQLSAYGDLLTAPNGRVSSPLLSIKREGCRLPPSRKASIRLCVTLGKELHLGRVPCCEVSRSFLLEVNTRSGELRASRGIRSRPGARHGSKTKATSEFASSHRLVLDAHVAIISARAGACPRWIGSGGG